MNKEQKIKYSALVIKVAALPNDGPERRLARAILKKFKQNSAKSKPTPSGS